MIIIVPQCYDCAVSMSCTLKEPCLNLVMLFLYNVSLILDNCSQGLQDAMQGHGAAAAVCTRSPSYMITASNQATPATG